MIVNSSNGILPLNPNIQLSTLNPQQQLVNSNVGAASQISDAWKKFVNLAKDLQNAENLSDAQKLKSQLKAYFGPSLIDRVFTRYNFNSHASFTSLEYQVILNGIASLVNKADLKTRFDALKKLNEPKFSKFNCFEDLDEKHIGLLLDQFTHPTKEYWQIKERQIEIKINKTINVVQNIFLILSALTLMALGSLLFVITFPLSLALAITGAAVAALGLTALIFTSCSIHSYNKNESNFKPNGPNNKIELPSENNLKSFVGNKSYREKAVDDIDFLKMKMTSSSFKFDHSQKIAASEFLAHEAAYLNLEAGQIIPIYEAKQVIHAQVSYIVNKEGFVCFLLTPVQEKRHKKHFTLWEVFRGTHDKKSLKRLGEPHSAGHSSFKLYSKELMEAKAELTKNALSVREIKCGHSLGGADAQRALALIVSLIAMMILAKLQSVNSQKATTIASIDIAKITPYLEKIRSASARVWNSAGIAHSTNDQFKKNVQIIRSHTKASGHNPKLSISVCKVGGDAIQQTGETTLGHKMGQDPNVEREMYKFQHGLEGLKAFIVNKGLSTLKAHKIVNTNRQINGGHDPKYKYAHSNSDLATLDAEYGNHFRPWKLWEKTKWFMTSRLFGSSIHDGQKELTPDDLECC